MLYQYERNVREAIEGDLDGIKTNKKMEIIWSKLLLAMFFLFLFFGQNQSKECYRCRNAQTFSTNLTTSLLPLSPGKPCVLETIRCAHNENSCVYGLVSVIVAGGFWFHLSGCYVETINETHCYRGVGPVHWPGYTAELRANYCLCGSGRKNEASDLCNDSRFARAVVSYNFNQKNGAEKFALFMNNSAFASASSSSASTIKNRAATGHNGEKGQNDGRVYSSAQRLTFDGLILALGIISVWSIWIR